MITCLGDALYPEVGDAVVKVLGHLGVKVDFPAGQTCCGQPAFNSGYVTTRDLGAHYLGAFAGSEHVVSISGSCAAMVRHHYPVLFEGGPRRVRRGRWPSAPRSSRSSSRTYSTSATSRCGTGAGHLAPLLPHDAPARRARGAGAAARHGRRSRVPAAAACRGLLRLRRHLRRQDGGDLRRWSTTRRPRARDRGRPLLGLDMSCLMNIGGRLRRRGARASGQAPRAGAGRGLAGTSGGCGRAASGATRADAGFDAIVRSHSRRRGPAGLAGGLPGGAQDWHARRSRSWATPEAWRDAVSAVRGTRWRTSTATWPSSPTTWRPTAVTCTSRRRRRGARLRRRGRAAPARAARRQGEVHGDRGDRPERRARGLGVEVVETDLGAFIVQLSGEKPYHITGPALHKTLEQVRELFSREAGRGTARGPDVAGRLRPGHSAREVPDRRAGHLGRQLRHRLDGHGRPGHQRGQRAHVHDAAPHARRRDGHGAAAAGLEQPRSGAHHADARRHGERITTYVSAITGPRREGTETDPTNCTW